MHTLNSSRLLLDRCRMPMRLQADYVSISISLDQASPERFCTTTSGMNISILIFDWTSYSWVGHEARQEQATPSE